MGSRGANVSPCCCWPACPVVCTAACDKHQHAMCISMTASKATIDSSIRVQVLPHVFSALEANARSHWNPAVHGLTCNVRKMFQEMDEELYEECRQRYEKDEVGPAASLEPRLPYLWAR